MERCGKINASNSGADSWTGIGVVAGFCTVVLIMQWPHRRKGEVTGRSELLQRLQDVRRFLKKNFLIQGVGTGLIKMSYLGNTGWRSKRASTACIAALPSAMPFW